MNPASWLALLQAAAALLTFASGRMNLSASSTALAQSAVNFGSNAVQIVEQATAPIGFQVPPNDSFWPDIKDLSNAPYIDGTIDGVNDWTQLGSAVTLLPNYTSFGDLNHDGVDDAAAIVERPSADGTANYYLAAMLNQGGIMFNIADYPLGTTLNIASHTITSDIAWLNNSSYELLGNAWIKTN